MFYALFYCKESNKLSKPLSFSFLTQAMLLSPLAERNWEDVCSVLEEVLEDQSDRELFALELGSGTGQHVIHFARKIPFITWQPSDIKEEFLDRLDAMHVA
jgi:tRNA G46 methylase TrmB